MTDQVTTNEDNVPSTPEELEKVQTEIRNKQRILKRLQSDLEVKLDTFREENRDLYDMIEDLEQSINLLIETGKSGVEQVYVGTGMKQKTWGAFQVSESWKVNTYDPDKALKWCENEFPAIITVDQKRLEKVVRQGIVEVPEDVMTLKKVRISKFSAKKLNGDNDS